MDSFTKKVVNYFCKTLHFRFWTGFSICLWITYVFSRDSKKDRQESLIYTKLIKVFAPNLGFSPFYKVVHGSATFKLAKGYQRLKKNDQLLNLIFLIYFFFFFYFLHSNVWDNKCHKQKWCMLFCTHIKLVPSMLARTCRVTCIKWRRLILLRRDSVDTKIGCYKITEYSVLFI